MPFGLLNSPALYARGWLSRNAQAAEAGGDGRRGAITTIGAVDAC